MNAGWFRSGAVLFGCFAERRSWDSSGGSGTATGAAETAARRPRAASGRHGVGASGSVVRHQSHRFGRAAGCHVPGAAGIVVTERPVAPTNSRGIGGATQAGRLAADALTTYASAPKQGGWWCRVMCRRGREPKNSPRVGQTHSRTRCSGSYRTSVAKLRTRSITSGRPVACRSWCSNTGVARRSSCRV